MDGGCCSKRPRRAGKPGATIGVRRAAIRFPCREAGA